MFSNPTHNIKRLELREGMKVADFGSGSGHYTMEASSMVGNTGQVYAIDIQRDLLQKLKNHAIEEKRGNISIIHGDIEQVGGTKLGDGAIDAVILANTLFQAESKENMALEVTRVLKRNGKLLVVDWTDSFGGIGPQYGDVVSEREVRGIFDDDFEFSESFDAGEHHYGLVFLKK